MREKIEAIQSLLAVAKEEYQWGGSEDKDGCLGNGYVDFEELEERIICILEDREYVAPKPYTPPTPEPGDPDTTWVSLDSLPLKE